MLQEAAQLPDSKVDASFADELFEKVIGLPAGQQDESYIPPHTLLQVKPLLKDRSGYQSSTCDLSEFKGGSLLDDHSSMMDPSNDSIGPSVMAFADSSL